MNTLICDGSMVPLSKVSGTFLSFICTTIYYLYHIFIVCSTMICNPGGSEGFRIPISLLLKLASYQSTSPVCSLLLPWSLILEHGPALLPKPTLTASLPYTRFIPVLLAVHKVEGQGLWAELLDFSCHKSLCSQQPAHPYRPDLCPLLPSNVGTYILSPL